MNKIKKRKIIAVTLLIVAVCICLSIGTVYHFVHEQQLDELQNEALAQLDRNQGEYDEQSIVLQSTSKARAQELAKQFGAELRITKDGRYAKLTLPDGITIRDVYTEKENRKYIEEMSADYKVKFCSLGEVEESDARRPLRPQYTVSDTEYDQQTYLDYLNMSDVWSSYTGSGITVAVIDTGIDTDHPEFAGRISEYSYNVAEDKIVKDCKDENGNLDWSLIEDEQGHGTAVTGVIAANMNSGNIVGVAPEVTILTIKVPLNNDGRANVSDLTFGLYYAIERDVQVVNMPFSSCFADFEEVLQLAYDSDVICVAAAGNDGTAALSYPASDPHVIGVGALNADSWSLADYSNYGENSDLVAPGTIYTTLKDGGYGTVEGTSLASSLVTSAIVLYMQSNKYTTFDEVAEILYASCYDLGNIGNDWDYGFGALDISAFLLEERGTVTYDMLTDELDNTEGVFVHGHALQELPEPERLYAIFDGWYYDDTFTQAVEYYTDVWESDLTLYAKWVNEDDGVPYTYVILDDGTVEIRSYRGHRRYITIPEKIDGRVVSSIGDFAFSSQSRLREVELPSGLTKVGRYAFENCSNLTHIEIPEGVKTIGEGAFTNNTRLSSVAFLGNSKLTSIGRYAFEACGKLDKIELPAILESIHYTTFYQTVSLHTIDVHKSNPYYSSIDGVLFDRSGDSLLIYPAAHGTDYTLPEQTIAIESYAFWYARIHTIDLNKVVSIGEYAFQYSSLQELEIPDSVTYLGNKAFSDNHYLLSIVLGRGLTEIKAFSDCSALTKVLIPNCIVNIGLDAFARCGLDTVTFEEGSVLTEIGSSAFESCKINEIEIPASVSKIDADAFASNPLVRVVLTQDSELRSIGENAFLGCDLLSSINLPNKLETIGAEAFSGCISLKNIVLPQKLKFIDTQAFMSCGLTEMTIPASVTHLGFGPFACCEALTAIEVEEGNAYYHDIDGVVYTIDNETIHSFPAGKAADEYVIESTVRTINPLSFGGTNLLGTVVVPEGITEIGDHGFYLSGAKAYSLPSTLTKIGVYSFSNNHNLITLALPEGVVELGRSCFEFSSTENYTLPSTVTVISIDAFKSNYNLQYITLPESLVQISEGAFANCHVLKSIHIPDNVLQIGRYAFENDWGLTSVTFNATSKLPRISYGSFAYSGITSFTVPANVSTVAQKAFEGCYKLTSITFAENSKLDHIPAYLFNGCTNLQYVTFQNGSALTSVLAHAFDGADKLTSINFGDAKVTNIDNFAFRFCENLSRLNLPETLTNIGRYAFYGCKSMSELSIPAPVEHIGSYAFLGTNDIDLYFASHVLPTYLDENWDRSTRGYYVGVTTVITDGDYKYGVLTSGDIAIIEYLGSETHIDLTTLDFGAPITAIGGSAFKDSSVISIVLPDTLVSIQAEAFQYCALESIAIPASVTFIGREAFAHTWIASLTFGENSQLTVIEQYAFEGTENLTSVTLPASLTTMGTGTFSESGLGTLIFENGIKLSEIPQQAFAETKLTTVALPDSVTLVNHNAFNNVTTLKNVSFGNNDIRLMSNAFYHTGLETLHIPANMTYIGEYCFVALSNLKEFTVDDSNPNYTAVDGLLLTKSGRKLIAVPAGRTGSLNVPLSIEEIGFGAFEESKLSEILFHEDANILTFGYRAFFKSENIVAISIPKSVVSIDYYAFAYCKNLKTVNFVEGNKLKGIYEGAFLGDINLENITIPDTIMEISDFAFYGCSKIDKLPISENNALKGIYDYAFAYTGLKGEFTIPETLNDIGNYAFLGTKLTKVTVPDANKKILIIGIGAFEACNKLEEITLPFIGASYENDEISWFGYIFGAGAASANEEYIPVSLKTVTITEGITAIYPGGFSNCSGLENINVPHSVSKLYVDSFWGVTAKYELTNVISTDWGVVAYGHIGRGISGHLTLADTITGINANVFAGCRNLTGVTLGDNVTNIGHSAFSGCTSLVEINIGNGVTFIDYNTFVGCSSLTSVKIGDSLTGMGSNVFLNCHSLEEYIVSEENTVYSSYDGILYDKAVTTILATPYSISGEVEIAPGITEIGALTFNACSGITGITLPDSVTTIGEAAFTRCSKLKWIIIPDSVTTIGASAFNECGSIESITIPKSVKTIGAYAFKYCGSLRNVTIVNGVTTLGDSVFYGCSSLTEITLPDSLTSIGASAFIGCSNLTKVTLGKNVVSIGASAFYECKKLTDITLSDSLVSLGERTFYSCENLQSIVIPDQVTSLNAEIFKYCRNLTDVVIGDGVSELGSSIFSGCEKLTSITIGDGITSIDPKAFEGCNHLKEFKVSEGNDTFCAHEGILYDKPVTKVVQVPNGLTGTVAILDGVITVSGFMNRAITGVILPDSVNTIGDDAFNGCNQLLWVTIPDSVTIIESGAFANCGLTGVTIPASVTEIGSTAFNGCGKLYEVKNLSALSLSIGSTENGYVAYYAKTIVDKDGNRIYKDANSPYEYVDTPDGFRFAKENDQYTLIAYIGTEETITLPASIQGSSYTISYFKGGKHIVLSDGITKISDYAFSGHSDLLSVTISNSVTSIGMYAFSNCSSLTSIVIPGSVTTINNFAFYGCYNLKNVEFGNGLKTIGYRAFYYCGCLESLTIPQSVTSIGNDAFYSCSKLSSLIISDSAVAIGNYAFMHCSKLSNVTLGANARSTGRYAFAYCSSLKSVTIPSSMATIGEHTFYGCSALNNVVISNGITSIANYAFAECRGLTQIRIPSSVSSISSTAFSGCVQIKSFEIAEDNSHYSEMDGIIYNGDATKIVYVPINLSGEVVLPDSLLAIDNSAFANRTELTDITIPNSVTQIGADAFSGCIGLTSIEIPYGVIQIGGSAFRNCSNLVKVEIANSVTRIGDSAFNGCTALTSIEIPDSVTWIDSYAFYGCSSLTNIVLSDSITYIGWSTFYGCTSLKQICLPDNITSINGATFYGCSSLKYVVLPEGVTAIDTSAFEGCSSLESIKLPDGLNTIGSRAFAGCSNLTCIVIPDGITTIEYQIFMGCEKLASVTIPDGVTSIGSEAFFNCYSLTSITIPDRVTSIGNRAFSNCDLTEVRISDLAAWCTIYFADENANPLSKAKNLYLKNVLVTNVVIPNGVESISEYAFYGCDSLQSVTIPDGVTTIGLHTFGACSNLKSIVVSDGNPNYCSQNGVLYDKPVTQIICIPHKVSGEIVFLNGITTIGDTPRLSLENVTRVVIPASVTTIEDYKFVECTNLAEIVVSEDNPSYCSYNGVLYDKPVTKIIQVPNQVTGEIVIPEGVTVIPSHAFYQSSLSSVTIGNSVTTIGSYAFNKCDKLKTLVLGESVSTIGYYAFYQCEKMEVLYNYSSLAPRIGGVDYGYVACYVDILIDNEGNKTYRDGAVEYIETADGFRFVKVNNSYSLIEYVGSMDTVELPLSIEGQTYQISYFSGAKHVIIPNGITAIDAYAFNGCDSLVSIVIPDSVTSIGSSAFENCSQLTSIVIPNSVTTIDINAFNSCSKLENVVLPNHLTRLYSGVFSNCENLTNIALPDGLIEIGANAFQNCSRLENVNIPESVIGIGESAFVNTDYSNDSSHWKGGMLILDGWLIAVEEDLKYISVQGIKGVADGLFNNNRFIKNPIWSTTGISGVTNVETLIVPHLSYLYEWSVPSNSSMMTLKNVVLLNSVGLTELRQYSEFFKELTGVTIYVEANEDDLRWDDNFPGWNNGNRVIYGNNWNWVNFYDENGYLLYTAPRLNAEIIRIPVYEIEADDRYSYELIGWDMDGDGYADSVPATSIVDVNAVVVIKRIPKTFNIVFKDAVTGEVYYAEKLLYGTVITPPVSPIREGTFLESWNGYTVGMIVSGDVEFTANWHEHILLRRSQRAPTCTEIGWEAYEECSRCDYSTYIEVPATGHTHTAYDYGESEHWSICSVCGTSYDESAHNFIDRECCCGAVQIIVNAHDSIQYTVIKRTIIVRHDIVCKVGYLVNDSYVAIQAITNNDGSYSFILPDKATEILLVAVGDLDGNGTVDSVDQTVLSGALMPEGYPLYVDLTAEQLFIADVNYNGVLNSADVMLLARHLLDQTHPLYQELAWLN